MTTLRIGELASKGNVNLETIRYYEREGLMPPPQRTPSGHGAYAPGDVLRLRFIKRSQALGFRLTEIKELLTLKVAPNQPCIEPSREPSLSARRLPLAWGSPRSACHPAPGPGQLRSLASPAAFEALCEKAAKIEWVVHIKPPFGGPQRVLKYLARYTHRVAMRHSGA